MFAPPFWEQAVVTACWLSVCTTVFGAGGGYRLLAKCLHHPFGSRRWLPLVGPVLLLHACPNNRAASLYKGWGWGVGVVVDQMGAHVLHATRPYCSSSPDGLFGNLPICAMAAVARAQRVPRVPMEAARVTPCWKAEELLAHAMYPFV